MRWKMSTWQGSIMKNSLASEVSALLAIWKNGVIGPGLKRRPGRRYLCRSVCPFHSCVSLRSATSMKYTQDCLVSMSQLSPFCPLPSRFLTPVSFSSSLLSMRLSLRYRHYCSRRVVLSMTPSHLCACLTSTPSTVPSNSFYLRIHHFYTSCVSRQELD